MKIRAEDAPAVRRVEGVTWLRVPEAAARLGVTRVRVYHLITAGRLRIQRFGPLLYVREQDVRLQEVRRRAGGSAR